MAAFRYAELKSENQYLSETHVDLRKIEKNSLEMQKMNRVYCNNSQLVKNSEPKLNQRIMEKQIFESTRK